MSRVPGWRIAAAVVVMAALALYAALFAPIYWHNHQLQNFVAEVAAHPGRAGASDDLLRTWILDKAHELHLPVKAGDIQILRSGQTIRIDVRYVVRVIVPGYTVDLHFYPGVGGR